MDDGGNPLPPYGVCQLDGTATTTSTSCSLASNADPASLCASGEECVSVDLFGDTACIDLCDPTSWDAGSCGADAGCFGFYTSIVGEFGIAPTYGICLPCTTVDAGYGCLTNSECCSLNCVGPADGGQCQ